MNRAYPALTDNRFMVLVNVLALNVAPECVEDFTGNCCASRLRFLFVWA
jgi:hypothetical protein